MGEDAISAGECPLLGLNRTAMLSVYVFGVKVLQISYLGDALQLVVRVVHCWALPAGNCCGMVGAHGRFREYT